SDQFAEGLEALFNSGAPFEDPFAAATDHSRSGGGGYTDDYGLSLFGAGWQGTGNDSSGSAGGHDSTAGAEGSSGYSPLGNGLSSGASAPPIFTSGTSQPTFILQPSSTTASSPSPVTTGRGPTTTTSPPPVAPVPSSPTPTPTEVITWSSP